MTIQELPNQASNAAASGFGDSLDYVTVMIGDQILGLPIGRVHDVFIANRITAVPSAPPEIVGLLNLRGRVVTAICLRKRLGQPVKPGACSLDQSGKPGMCDDNACELVAVGIDHGGEAYALIADAVGEVMRLDQSTLETVPVHLDRHWSALAAGVHRLDERLLVVLDVDAVLKLDLPAAA
jgi:purine-binding chemotaxis protein CheW